MDAHYAMLFTLSKVHGLQRLASKYASSKFNGIHSKMSKNVTSFAGVYAIGKP